MKQRDIHRKLHTNSLRFPQIMNSHSKTMRNAFVIFASFCAVNQTLLVPQQAESHGEDKNRLSMAEVHPDFINSDAAWYRPKLQLIMNNRNGISVSSTDYTPGNPRISGKLISLDGIPLKGKSLHEIELLLYGPENSTVEVTFLESDGSLTSERVKRCPRRDFGTINESYARSLFLSLQDERSIQWSTCANTNYITFESNNLDLFLRASRNVELERLEDLPEPKSNTIFDVASDALIASDSVGDLKGAGKCLDLILANQAFESGSREHKRSAISKLINHLIQTGRTEGAAEVCNSWLSKLAAKSRESRDWHDQNDEWQTLKRLAEAQKENCAETLSKMLTMSAAVHSQNWDEIGWLGNALERIGNHEKALACFESIKPFERPIANSIVSNDSIEPVAYYALRIAQSEELCGQHAKAITTLLRLLDLIDKRVSTDDQDIAEREPCFYPARSDVEFQLARLYLGQDDYATAETLACSAISRVEKALGKSALPLKPHLELLAKILVRQEKQQEALVLLQRASKILSPQVESDLTDHEKFSLFTIACKAIQKEDVQTSQDAVKQLITCYRSELPVVDFRRHPLNIFCALLVLSRELSDHQRFGEAHQILDILHTGALGKERTPVAADFIDVERCITYKLQGNMRFPWALVDERNHLVEQSTSFLKYSDLDKSAGLLESLRKQENMRRFAALYLAAGYGVRAECLIARALELSSTSITNSAAIQSRDVQECRVLTLLDAAIIYASAGQFQKVKSYSMEAISLCNNNSKDDDETPIMEFASARIYKLVHLTEVLSKKNQEATALEILQALVPKLEPITTESLAKMHDKSDGFVRLRQNSIVKAYLAKLLFHAGKIKEAQSLIPVAIEEAHNNVPFQFSMVGAKIAESAKNFGLAAHYCAEAEKASVFNSACEIGLRDQKLKLDLLNRAIYNAEKAHQFNQNELANIYVRAAIELDRSNFLDDYKRELSLLQKANALTPESNPKKVELILRIGNVEGKIRTYDARGTLQAVGLRSPGVPASKVAEEAQLKAEIEIDMKAAELAEKLKRRDASEKWINVAQLEGRAKRFDSAAEHLQRGISLFSKDEFTFTSFSGLLSGYHSAIAGLKSIGRTADADTIMERANTKVATECGAHSPEAATQYANYFAYLLNEGQDSRALAVLDEIIAMGMRQIELGSYSSSALELIIRASESTASKGKGDLSQKILSKILDAQRKTFARDDLRICNTLVAMAKVNLARNQMGEAEKNLNEAISIKKLYSGENRAIADLSEVAVPLFKQLGRTEELKRTEALSQNRFRLSPDVIDAKYYRENKRVRAVYDKWAKSRDVDAMQAEYEEARKQAPYSPRCIDALETLLEYAACYWPLVVDSASKRIEIYSRIPDSNAGRPTGCTGPRFTRIRLYSRVIEANIELGRKLEAQKWINRATIELPLLADYELIELAKLAQKCGNRAQAIKFATAAEKSMTANQSWLYSDLAHIWQTLGYEKHQSELSKKEKEADKKREELYRQQDDNPLSGL